MRNRKKNPGEVVGIVGDIHAPYTLDGYLEFCQATFERHEVNRVIFAGDVIDHHALSFHDSEPSLKGAMGERLEAQEVLAPWYRAFPKVEITEGNHDIIPKRWLKKLGMESHVYLRTNAEIYGYPPGWTEVEHVFSNGVLYHHGMTAVADFGYAKDARARMCNTVTGHAHSNFGVGYTANDTKMVWGMGVGCGVDRRSMAFAYGKHFPKKPIIGCGVVLDDGKLPVCFPMDLGSRP
jgi:predicted phosphodiesterase